MLTDRLKDFQITLGSVSPRRHELLAALGLSFDVADPDINEDCPPGVPLKMVAEYLAQKKADSLSVASGSNKILITADTVVLCGSSILAKPADREEAIRFLKLLSGKKHSVITGVCISGGGNRRVFSEETIVTFCPLDDEEIDYYVDTFTPFDKAGGYGIQEWIGYAAIERIEGSYFNVMGLPVNRLYRELKKFIQ
jgi:septum formation protein